MTTIAAGRTAPPLGVGREATAVAVVAFAAMLALLLWLDNVHLNTTRSPTH